MHRQANPQSNRRAPAIDVAAMLNGWADSEHGTLARRLALALRRSIQAGVLPADLRLPSERQLADELAVSRSTVTQALDELRSAGLLDSTCGRGTFVVAPPAAVPGTRVADHLLGEVHGIDLAAGNPPDPSHLPAVGVDVAALLAAGGGPSLSPLGLPALREAIAERWALASSQHVDAEQVHVTAGAHQAVSLLVGCLTGPGRPLVLEQPNWPGVFDVADGLGAELVAVGGDDAGILPESLERALRDSGAGALYVQAGPHNPTGRVAAPARVQRLAAIADRAGVVVIEDHTLAPLTFDGSRPALFADHCRTATVVSVGSLSKVAWAGLRIGWMVGPPPLIDRTFYRRLGSDLGASVPSQLLALALLPHIDEMIEQRRATLARSADRAIERLADVLPEAKVTRPAGGTVMWLELPIEDSNVLVRLARRHGVTVAPGSITVAGRIPGPYLRICVDRPWDLLQEGIDRLARAWRDLADDHRARVVG